MNHHTSPEFWEAFDRLVNGSLIMVPSTPARIGWSTFEIATALAMAILARPWQQGQFGYQRLLLLALSIVLLLAGLEFPWRKVVIGDAAIRERLWFHWRTHDLPYRVLVGRDSRGRAVVAEAPTGRIVYRFIREFGKPAAIEKQLAAFFHASGQLEADA